MDQTQDPSRNPAREPGRDRAPGRDQEPGQEPDQGQDLPEDAAAWRAAREAVMAELAGLPAGDPYARELCGRAGELSYLLALEESAPEDLELAAEAFAHAFRPPGPGEGPGWPLRRIMYGHLLGLRYDEQPDPELLERFHDLVADGLAELPHDPGLDEAASLARWLLAFATKARYQAAEGDRDLLDQALHRNLSALEAVEGGDTDLQVALGYLWFRHGMLGGGEPSFANSVRYLTLAVEAGGGEGSDDPALVRQARGMSLTLLGTHTLDRTVLEEARAETAAALADVRTRGGTPPDWVRDAELRIAFIRTVIAVHWKDEAQGALAEADLAALVTGPRDMDRLDVAQLDVFGRLLCSRGMAQQRDGLLDRGVEMLTRALDRWKPERDGKPTRAALTLGMSLNLRQDTAQETETDPERLRAVVRALRLALADEELTGEERDHALLLLLDAQTQLPQDGPPDVSPQEMSRMFNRLKGAIESGERIDFGTDNPLLADTPQARRRWRLRVDPLLRSWEAMEEGSRAKAETAALILGSLHMIDPHGDRLGEEREAELTRVVLEHAREHEDWRGRGHTVLAMRRFGQGGLGDAARFTEAMEHFEAAREAGREDPLLEFAEQTAAGMGEQYTGVTGGFADAVERWSGLMDSLDLSPRLRLQWACQQGTAQTIVAAKRGDLPAADRHLAAVAEAVAELPREDTAWIEVWAQYETARIAREDLAHRVGAPRTRPPAGRPSAAELRAKAAKYPRQGRANLLGDIATGWIRDALQPADLPRLREALALVEEAAALSKEGGESWVRFTAHAGGLYCTLAMAAPQVAGRVVERQALKDLERAIVLLRGAVDAMGGPEHRLWSFTALPLGRAYRSRPQASRADREAGRRLGMDSLRGYVWAALLQSGTHDAAEAARLASENSEEVVRWCLADNALEEAVQALDACRGLVLHTATTSRSVPELLVAAGREDLAGAWRRGGGGAGADAVPTALRREALSVLAAGTGSLFDPPGAAEIGARLSTLRKDALVYLVPASFLGPGTALVVTARGDVHAVPLPRLTEDAAPLRDYLPGAPAGRDVGPVPGWAGTAAAPGPGQSGGLPLREQLDRLCSWAWYAAVRPLFDLFTVPDRPGRVARLVLLPMGSLGVVPWHAAWSDDGSGRRHAIEEAEISYAPSARLLCEVAARPPAPHTGTALIVGDPTGDLRYAGEEADAVHRVFYPDGRLLGLSTGDGTPQQVADWLRGEGDEGAVLHLACHGTVAENRPRSSYLSLKGGELTAEEVTDSLPGRLGLVVLAACRSQVSGRGYNEAYSLASAFLVAGTRSVIGSLWPVPDEATSVLMFMTHHFLRREQEPPARALRRAQLWVLDPDRTVPPELPQVLADRLADLDPRDLSAWAGFTHLGQ
ncbi:CHAT domain-containing protein [Streptomyces goshikiensis]|uniref:CHAT domain-containing protein n=1 Tax=Streptomyces goshikiensis TaxID=1942 RepID=UPI003658BC98